MELQSVADRLETVDAKIDIDLRIFPLPVIERVIHALSDGIVDIKIEEDSPDKIRITLKFLSPSPDPEETCDLFHAKLISASATANSFEKRAELSGYFSQSAFNVTTATQAEVIAQAPTRTLGKGVDMTIAEDKRTACINIDAGRYALPEVLQAVNKMREQCQCGVDASDPKRITVKISAEEEETLFSLGKTLYRELLVAKNVGFS